MITNYKLFMTPTCPGCPRIKEYLKDVKLKGEIIDAATDKGAAEASKFGVTSVPTVVFFDKNNEALEEAHTVQEIQKVLA